MLTTVYFVRHAQPDYTNHDDLLRPLTSKGMQDRQKATTFLLDKKIDSIYSSPCKRSIDTIKHFSEIVSLPINVTTDFREREIGPWIDNFGVFAKKQWIDFDYKLQNGESIGETQTRNIDALSEVLQLHKGQSIVVSSHGTAISAIINYFDPSFGWDDFLAVKDLMPFIVCMEFEDETFKQHRIIKV